jgi:single-strand DNA-binding protein
VIATGRLQQRSYEDRHGKNRTVIELLVDEIGPSLKWATAKTEKRTRSLTTAERPAEDETPF